jgi:hypothetical protein
MKRDVAASTLLVAILCAITGCATSPASSPATRAATPSTQETASAEPTASASARPEGFFIPKSCKDAVPADRLASFASQGLPLIIGPGSPSAQVFDRAPVESDTTDVQCIWGTADLSTSVEIDIGSLSEANRPIVAAQLKGQYLDYAKDGNADRYFMNGKELLKFNGDLDLPAQMNVLRTGSWITVAILPGGPDQFEVAKAISDEVETITQAN